MSSNHNFSLPPSNYIFVAIGFILIIIGLLLMSGGGDHTSTFFDESIYDFRRVTLAPILMVLGFAFEIFAIMRVPKQNK